MEQQLKENYEFYINADLEKYIGEWVAICNNKIVSHGKNAKEVFEKAVEKCPGKKPLLSKVPSKAAMIF